MSSFETQLNEMKKRKEELLEKVMNHNKSVDEFEKKSYTVVLSNVAYDYNESTLRILNVENDTEIEVPKKIKLNKPKKAKKTKALSL